MSDPSRVQDLKELYEARKYANAKDRDRIDKIRYDIQNRQNNPAINEARRELVGSMRIADGKNVRRVSERIKHLTHKLGVEKDG